jgi:hypothetical protein
MPGMVGAIRTFVQWVHSHPHVQDLVTEHVLLLTNAVATAIKNIHHKEHPLTTECRYCNFCPYRNTGI